MQIIINDTNELTELDFRMLQALVGVEASSSPVSQPKAKTAPAPKVKAEPVAEEPEPVAEEPEPETEPVAEVTMKDAVALATKLVSDGQAVKVKAALGKLGAKRVSELTDEDVPKFVASLS